MPLRQTEMLRLDSSAFLLFEFFRKLRQGNAEEATSASSVTLQDWQRSNRLAGNNNRAKRV